MKFIYLMILLSLSNSLLGQDEQSAMQFLRISPSPRAAALGNAYTSVLGNCDTMFYNPGAMAFFKFSSPSFINPDQYAQNSGPFIKNMSVSMAYSKWIDDLNFLAFSSIFDLRKIGVVGLGFTSILNTEIPETINTSPDTFQTTGRNLGNSSYNFLISYANMIGNNIGIGGNMKFIMENLAGETISGMAIDAGLLYHNSDKPWSIGFVVQNAGIDIKKIDQSFNLPITFKLGGNYLWKILKNSNPDMHTIMVSCDVGTGLDSDSSLSLGLEYGFKKIVFLRVGYQYSEDEPGIKTGFGVIYKNFAIDYAFVPLSDFNNVHKISLTYRLQTVSVNPQQEEKKVTKLITERGIEIALNDVIFEFDNADLRPQYLSVLDKAIEIIKEYKDYDIIIEGHTDIIGTDEYNLELSKKRAQCVYDYFIKHGLDSQKITYTGYGKNEPIADNSIEAGREKNRRIYIVLTKALTQEEYKEYYSYFYSGMDYYVKEGYQSAIDEWNKALDIEPHDPSIKYWIDKAKMQLAKKNSLK